MVRLRKVYAMDPAKAKELALADVKGSGILVSTVGLPGTDRPAVGRGTPAGEWAGEEAGETGPVDVSSPPADVNRAPLAFCSIVARYPKASFGFTLSGHLAMLGVTIILLAMGYNVFPAEFRTIPFSLTGHRVTHQYWAWLYRNDPRDVTPRFTWQINTWPRGMSRDPLQVMYNRHDGGNVFEKSSLRQIRALEDKLFRDSTYRGKLCQVDRSRVDCVRPLSVLQYFDGSMANVSSVFYDPEFDNVTAVLYAASRHPATAHDFQYFLGNCSVLSPDAVFSDYTRSEFPIGHPIEGVSGWQEVVGEIQFQDLAPAIERWQHQVAPDLRVSPITWAMFAAGAGYYGLHDIALVAGSVVFIFLFMWFQTRSLWVTFWAVFSIITSFFGTNLIYRYVLDFRYFSYFHLIAMFIILGIGADDIFVFFNTWKASAFERHVTLAQRLSEVYRRAAVSMFVTSFTTMVAFFATSLTPLLAARSFGIFTGLLVIINYISVVVFFPTVMITYHLYFEFTSWFPACINALRRRCCSKSVEAEEDQPERPNICVRFFNGPYFRLVSHPIWRWVLLLVFLTIVGVFTWTATSLQADSEQVMIFKETTLLGRGWKLFFTAFKPNDDSLLRTNVVWGLRPRNTSSCHFSEYKCRGRSAWDDGFDLNFPDAQIAMRDFCKKLKYNLTDDEFSALNIRRNAQGEAEVHCFMDSMEEFFQREAVYLRPLCGSILDLSLPLTEVKVRRFMKCLPCFYDLSKIPPTFHRYFEVMLSYWMTNRYSMVPTPDFRIYNSLLGEAPDGDNTQTVEFWNNNTADCPIEIKPERVPSLPESARPKYGTKLRFAAIPVNLSENFFGLGYSTGLPIYYKWEEYVKEKTKQLPYQLQRTMQSNPGQWHWLFVQETLVKSAFVGVVLGIGLALPVLILATQNYIVGTLATFIIAATVACVIGVIPLPGWKLGMLVSINLCLVVGLSIDYIVHMSEGYHMSPYADRLSKTRDTLSKTGVSVISGAITTLGASFFMFFGRTQFFLQFAAFMFSTIGFSTIFSLGLFPVLMGILGPQGEVGSLAPIARAIKRCFTGRRSDDVDCGACAGRGFLPPKEADAETAPDLAVDGGSDAGDVNSRRLSIPTAKDETGSRTSKLISISSSGSTSGDNSLSEGPVAAATAAAAVAGADATNSMIVDQVFMIPLNPEVPALAGAVNPAYVNDEQHTRRSPAPEIEVYLKEPLQPLPLSEPPGTPMKTLETAGGSHKL